MKKNDKKYFVIIGFLTVSCIISWQLYFKVYRQEDTVDIKQFPKTIGKWRSEDLPITDDEYAILETRNAFVRRYSRDGGPNVYLFIVYSQNNRKVSHPPEVCYIGGGVTVVNNTRDTIEVPVQNLVIRTNKLLLEFKNFQQLAVYWFKVGDSFTSNYWKQQFLIAAKTLLGKPSSSALIRISADVNGDDLARSNQSIKEFAQEIVPFLFQYLP